MKKKSILTVLTLALTAVCCASVAFAAWVITDARSDKNTITIGAPVKVTLEGSAFGNSGVLPGGTVNATFTLKMSNADWIEYDYNFVIDSIEFLGGVEGETEMPFTFDTDTAVWQYKLDIAGEDAGVYADFNDTGVSVALDSDMVSDGDIEITISFKLNQDIPESYKNASLSFYLEIAQI